MTRTRNLPARVVIACLLAAATANPLAVMAKLTQADETRLGDYEQTIFGASRSNFSSETRLRALETNLFGKAKGGSDSKRLDAIGKLVGTKPKSVQYFPPMAPILDRSTFAPQPQDAPRNSQPSTPNAPYAQPADTRATSTAPNSYDKDEASQDLLRKALSQYQSGDTAGAERGFQSVLRTDPGNVDAHYNLGAIAEEKGDLAAAAHHYKVAHERNPGDSEIGDAYNAVSKKLAEAHNQKQKQAQQAHKQGLKRLADEAATAYKAGNFQAAINKLEEIRRQEPNDANVYFGLAQAYRGQGNLDKAHQLLAQAQSLAPDNNLYRSTLTEVEGQMRNRQTASGGNPAPDYGRGPADADPSRTAYDDGTPPGQLTPFDDQGMDRVYDRANDDRVRGPSLGSLGGLGGLGSLGALTGIGGLGALSALGGRGNLGGIGGLGGFGGRSPMGGITYIDQYRGGYPGAYPGGSTRMRRVVTSSLAGAALGAFASRGQRGGMKSGAARGAMYGGLYGLMGN